MLSNTLKTSNNFKNPKLWFTQWCAGLRAHHTSFRSSICSAKRIYEALRSHTSYLGTKYLSVAKIGLNRDSDALFSQVGQSCRENLPFHSMIALVTLPFLYIPWTLSLIWNLNSPEPTLRHISLWFIQFLHSCCLLVTSRYRYQICFFTISIAKPSHSLLWFRNTNLCGRNVCEAPGSTTSIPETKKPHVNLVVHHRPQIQYKRCSVYISRLFPVEGFKGYVNCERISVSNALVLRNVPWYRLLLHCRTCSVDS